MPGLPKTLPCISVLYTIRRLASSSVAAALMHLYEFLVVKFRLQLANGQIVEVPPTLIKRQKQHFTTLEGTGKSLIACTAFVLVKHEAFHVSKFSHFQWQQAECSCASQLHRQHLPCAQKDSLGVPTVHIFSRPNLLRQAMPNRGFANNSTHNPLLMAICGPNEACWILPFFFLQVSS